MAARRLGLPVAAVAARRTSPELLELAQAWPGATVVATLVVFTEGDERDDVISLGHLKLYPKEAGA